MAPNVMWTKSWRHVAAYENAMCHTHVHVHMCVSARVCGCAYVCVCVCVINEKTPFVGFSISH